MIPGYDSVNVDRIPRDDPTAIILGYNDGNFRTYPLLRARFPANPLLDIVVSARHPGKMLDVEDKDATPEEAPRWAWSMRTIDADPIVYCSAGQGPNKPGKWLDVRKAFWDQKVREPWYAIANYDLGTPTQIPQEYLAAGCIGLQYRSDTEQDLDYWIFTHKALEIAAGLHQGESEMAGVSISVPGDGTIRVAGVDGNGHPLLYTKQGGKWSVDDLTDEVISANPDDPRNKAGGYTVVP